jgi:hypothetical protein
VDGRGEILKHPTAMREAFHLGSALASFEGPTPSGPLDVTLFGSSPPRQAPAETRTRED